MSFVFLISNIFYTGEKNTLTHYFWPYLSLSLPSIPSSRKRTEDGFLLLLLVRPRGRRHRSGGRGLERRRHPLQRELERALGGSQGLQQAFGGRFLRQVVWALSTHRAGFQGPGRKVHRRLLREDRRRRTFGRGAGVEGSGDADVRANEGRPGGVKGCRR